MEVTHELQDELNGKIRINLAKDDYLPQVEKQLKEHRKSASMPGFRPGKVPYGMVKKMYGRAVMAEEINKVLSTKLNSYVTEEQLEILGNPLPEATEDIVFDINNPADFNFSYEIGVSPNFEVKLNARMKFDFHKIAINDELIEKYQGDVTRRYGKVNEVEEAGEKDMLSGEFAELDADGNVVEGGITNTSTISLEFMEDEFQKEYAGKKVGDVFDVDPVAVSKGHEDMGRMLGIDHAQVHTIEENKTRFQFTVKQIYHMEPAEMNQELFDKVYGEGNVTSEEEFKSKVSEELTNMFEIDSNRLLYKHVQEKLMDKFKLDLPDAFLKRWIIASNDKPVTEEQVEAEYDQYAESLRWTLIENKIIKENDIKVENEEVREFAKEAMRKNFAQYGMMEVEDEMLNNSIDQVLQNQEEVRKIYEQLFAEKMILVYKDKLKLVEKEVSLEDFNKLATV